MNALALLASGFLAGILFVVLCASGDPLNDLGNECADEGAWPRVDPAFHEGVSE